MVDPSEGDEEAEKKIDNIVEIWKPVFMKLDREVQETIPSLAHGMLRVISGKGFQGLSTEIRRLEEVRAEINRLMDKLFKDASALGVDAPLIAFSLLPYAGRAREVLGQIEGVLGLANEWKAHFSNLGYGPDAFGVAAG